MGRIRRGPRPLGQGHPIDNTEPENAPLRALLMAMADMPESRFHQLVKLGDRDWERLRDLARALGRSRIFASEEE